MYPEPTKKVTKVSKGRWSAVEHQRFLEALVTYGKDWDSIETHIATRDMASIRAHAHKFL